ncbi:MAG TPA: hypothetical protein VJ826_12305 [Candidatus Polarisedimenticolaceae bacterium]|nr:hypothetical protein [Candidatus Polarisedimenticolaceae bacterium]
MKVQIEKRNDGASVLRCLRPNGTVTFQKHEGKQAVFYPLHDLTHFAVESELTRLSGFFTLVASGWEIEETTGKSARGPIPDPAMVVERIVGLLDLERGGVARFSPGELGLSEDEIERVRRRMRELLSRWEAIPVGGMMELTWTAPSSR